MAADYEQNFTPLLSPSGHGGLDRGNPDWQQRGVEVVGTYNPISNPAAVNLNHDRIQHWIKNGAQPSDTVARLMKANPATAA